MALEWSNLLSVGVPEIDEQHQNLIKALNTLSDAMRSGKGKDEVGKLLEFACQYAQTHFRCEEEYFEKYNCPAAAENKEAHKNFITTFTGLINEFQEKGANFTFVLKIHRELSDWLVEHILGIDMKLRPYLK